LSKIWVMCNEIERLILRQFCAIVPIVIDYGALLH
jgi:hypothetical protein